MEIKQNFMSTRKRNIIHLMYGPKETVSFVLQRDPKFPEMNSQETLGLTREKETN